MYKLQVALLEGGLNGYWQYRDVSGTTFSRFGEVLLIPSYVGPDIRKYTVW